MKGVLNWVKSNLVVVICSAVIVLVLPLCWFFSSGWNTSIRESRQKTVQADYDKLRSFSLKYSVANLEPGAAVIEKDGAPNAKMTEWFSAQNARVKAAAEGVVKLAEEHNRRGHEVLVEGLLPTGAGPEGQSKAWRLASLIVGTPQEPSVYKRLFESLGAGDPRPPSAMFDVLRDAETRLRESVVGQSNRQLTLEEQKKITKSLVDLRAAEYQRRAREISYYANPDVLGTQIPRAMPKEPPSIREVFQWQADYWLTADLLNAVRLANTDERGAAVPVERAVVKKIEKIQFRPSAFTAHRPGEAGPSEETGGEVPVASPTAQVAPDFTRSISGRWSGPGNGVYDIRKAEMTLIVSAKGLPALFDAFGRSNFMTITDCDLYDVELWPELDRGYYFGNESVVRAKIEVEVVWLRSWTVPFMPADVKHQLGIPEPAPAAPEAPK